MAKYITQLHTHTQIRKWITFNKQKPNTTHVFIWIEKKNQASMFMCVSMFDHIGVFLGGGGGKYAISEGQGEQLIHPLF